MLVAQYGCSSYGAADYNECPVPSTDGNAPSAGNNSQQSSTSAQADQETTQTSQPTTTTQQQTRNPGFMQKVENGNHWGLFLGFLLVALALFLLFFLIKRRRKTDDDNTGNQWPTQVQ